MGAVRTVTGLKYGAGVALSLLLALAVGGGGIALGGALGYADARGLIAGTAYSRTDLLAGGALALLGALVILTAVFGVVYKLLADGVAAGTEHLERARGPGEHAGTAEEPSARRGGARTGPSPGEQAAREHGAGKTVPSAAGRERPQPRASRGDRGEQADPERTPEGARTDAGSDSVDRASAGREGERSERGPAPPEPTPEEIAFGATEGEEATEEGKWESATSRTDDDPLSDPDAGDR